MTPITGVFDLFDQQVRARPDAAALVIGDRRIPVSYRMLDRLVGAVAAELAGTGLTAGNAVGLMGANTVEFVVGLLAAARAGLVVAPLDPALPDSQRWERLDALGAQALIVGPSDAEVADPRSRIPTWTVRVETTGQLQARIDTGWGATGDVRGAAVELSGADALVLFTSGTTGGAKMVPLTHRNVAGSVRNICDTYTLGPDDATVAVMPFFHGHGLLAVLLATLASGGRVLLPARGRFSAHTFFDDADAIGATWYTAVPTIHQILLQRQDPGHRRPFRFIRSCSAPLPPAVARAITARFGAPVRCAYGMTETTHQAASQSADSPPGSVGRAAGLRVRIVDPEGHTRAPGAEGEVWVSGPGVTRGYLANPTATAQSFSAGWFRTGDLGALDTDGNLYLTGRIKNLINRGGEKISPERVEEVLAGCAGVIEAAVFAIPDPMYGERVGAAVVVSDGTDRDEILRHSRDRLAAFEIPERLDIVTELPHTAKGALDRRAVVSQCVG